MNHFIRLESIRHEENTLYYRFSSDIPVFKKRDFFIRYKDPIAHPSDSMNTIPFVGIMMPIAQAAGADLYVDSLDKAYAESLDTAVDYWKKSYPRWPFKTKLHAKLVSNDAGKQDKYGLLFSGGLDSLATYSNYRSKKPELFTVVGADFPCAETEFVTKMEKRFGEFAQKENVELRPIYTDMNEILDLRALFKYAPNWYGSVQHGLSLTSLTAPATHHYLKTLVIASCSHPSGDTSPCGSSPEIMRNVKWGGTSVTDDLQEMGRVQKIAVHLKKDENLRRFLRVCWMQYEKVNCSRCEKCLRTICELLVNNVDPNQCNFHVDSGTFTYLRNKIEKRFYLFYHGSESMMNYWRDIQAHINLEKMDDVHGSKEFFAWFSRFEKLKKKQNPALVFAWKTALSIRDFLKPLVKNIESALSPNDRPRVLPSSR